MEQNRITIDTHALIWYMHEDSNVNLSKRHLKLLIPAVSNGIIYVPIITLLEIFRVIKKGKYPILFDVLLSKIVNSQNFQIVPFDLDILTHSEISGF